MKPKDIRDLARSLNLNITGVPKTELIHQIQRKEGNFDCYATASLGICDQLSCLWRKDCIAAACK